MSFDVKNTGTRAGADAAQVYVGPPSDAPAGHPVRRPLAARSSTACRLDAGPVARP